MADPVLKFPPEQKGNPPAAVPKADAKPRRRRALAYLRRFRRMLLLVVLPLVAADRRAGLLSRAAAAT